YVCHYPGSSVHQNQRFAQTLAERRNTTDPDLRVVEPGLASSLNADNPRQLTSERIGKVSNGHLQLFRCYTRLRAHKRDFLLCPEAHNNHFFQSRVAFFQRYIKRGSSIYRNL